MKLGPDMRVEEDHCPSCGSMLDAVTAIDHNDMNIRPDHTCTMCVYCCTWLVWGEDMKLKLATQAEVDDIMSQPEAALIAQVLIEISRRNRERDRHAPSIRALNAGHA